MRTVALGGLLVLAGLLNPALAQPVPTPGQAADQSARRIEIRVASDGPPPADDLIRRTMAQGDPANWLTVADVPGEAWRQDRLTREIAYLLPINARGQITGCTPSPDRAAPLPDWVGKLCAVLIARARAVPALSEVGRRMADRLEVSVSFSFSRPSSSQPPAAILMPPQPIPGYAPQGGAFLTSWPPRRDWIDAYARLPAFKQPVEAPGGAELTGPAIGVMVADRASGDRLDCRVVQSSDNDPLDEAACTFARTVLQPAWAEAVPASQRRWPLLLSPQGKGFRAIRPDAGAVSEQGFDPAEQARLRALWRPFARGAQAVRMTGRVAPNGQVAHCWISNSAGTDRADVAACRLLYTEARIAPPRDMFGQPRSYFQWVQLELAP